MVSPHFTAGLSALLRYRDLPAERFPIEESFRKINSWQGMYHRWNRGIYPEIFKRKAQLNRDAPNARIQPLELWKRECHLLDMAKSGRPLVSVFGSCTWPVFVSKLSLLKSVMEDFNDIADFVVVYIDEAHPRGGIREISNNYYQIAAHRNVADRVTAAKYLDEVLPCPVLVDTMRNEATDWYSAFPARLYIVLDATIIFDHNVSRGFKPDMALNWLSKFVKCKRQL